MKKALVLLSGGLDSSTCLALAVNEGYEVTTLSFDYQQRHVIELSKSRALADHYGVKEQLRIPLPFYRDLGGSALTSNIEVPKHENVEAMQRANESDQTENIPVTYVPARNLIFLSIAVGTAEIIGADEIFIGVNALDYSGYPDCRPDFITSFEHTARLATRTGVTDGRLSLRTPLLDLSKKEIIELAHRLNMPFELTHSCYDPIGDVSCGACDSCLLRLKGFESAGLSDPIPYATSAK